MSENIIIGVDTGGTFTDLVMVCRGEVTTWKTPSTPADFSLGIQNGIVQLLNRIADRRKASFTLVHSSTVATNAVLERKGAKTGLIVTSGFRDLLEIGRQDRPSLYDFQVEKPIPLVAAKNRWTVNERISATGEILTRLDPSEIERVLEAARQSGVQTVAVSLLFSFLDPRHEERIARAAKKIGLPVTLSSRICPEFREFERTSTTVVNAYVSPNMKTYLEKLEVGVRKLGAKRIRIIQSNGGSLSPKAAGEEAAHTLLSGPAAGVLGALSVCRQALKPSRKNPLKLITFDMGGTSTDVALIDGSYQITTESEIAGWPIRVPMMDIHTVGAGGGSLAGVDAAGTLHVGPESAGADPGPCCYGKGKVPTVTDANLVLGRICPDHFLGGRKTLDLKRATRGIETLAARLGSTRGNACRDILRVVNSSMERAIRVISVERGYDPRDFTLVTFGGAGGLHVCDLAEALDIPRVFVPKNPGVLSAWGAVSADVIKDYSRTVMLPFQVEIAPDLDTAFGELVERATKEMKGEGFDEEALVLERSLDLRYAGQSYELNVSFGGSIRSAMNAFHRLHERRYGHRSVGEPMELVTLRVRAIGLLDKPMLEPIGKAIGKLPADSGPLHRHDLKAGARFSGPRILVEEYSTTWVPENWQGLTDRWGNILLEKT